MSAVAEGTQDSLAQNEEKPFRMRAVGGHAAIYAVGIVLAKAVGFLMLPVYTRFLTPADYGVLALVEMTLEVIAVFAGAQLAPGIFRFYHKETQAPARATVVSTALLLIGVSYAIVSLGVLAGAGGLSTLVFGDTRHAGLIRIAALGLMFQCFTIVPIAFARVLDRSRLIVGSNLVKVLLGVTLNVFFLVKLGWGVEAILVSTLINNIVVGGWLTVWTVRSVGLRFSIGSARDLLRYGVPLVISYFAAFIYTFGDRFFLNTHGDETAVGLYNLSYQFGFLLMMIGFGPFEQVWGPKRFEIARRSDRDEVLSRGFRYLNVALISIAVLLGVYIGDFLRIMTTSAFHPAATLVPVILLAYVINAWSATQDVGILVTEKTRFITIANWLSAAVAIAAYAIMIPRWLGWGAALATLAAFMTRWAVIYVTSQRLWPVRYQWGPVLRLLAAGALVVAGAAMMPALPLLPSMALHTCLVGLYLLALWHIHVLTEDEKHVLILQVRRVPGLLKVRGRAAVLPQ